MQSNPLSVVLGVLGVLAVLILLGWAANSGMRVECTYGKFHAAHRC